MVVNEPIPEGKRKKKQSALDSESMQKACLPAEKTT